MKYIKTYELFDFFKKKKSISDDEWITMTEELFYDLTDEGFTVELYTPESNILHAQSYWITIKKEIRKSIYDGLDEFELSEVLPTIEHTLGYLSEYRFKLKGIYFHEHKLTNLKHTDKGVSGSTETIKHKHRSLSGVYPGIKTYGVQIELKKK